MDRQKQQPSSVQMILAWDAFVRMLMAVQELARQPDTTDWTPTNMKALIHTAQTIKTAYHEWLRAESSATRNPPKTD